MKYFFYIALALSITSCGNQDENPASETFAATVNNNVASLYPFNGKWLELQNLEWIHQANDSRNFKKSDAYTPPMKTESYVRWCENGQCYQFNQFKSLEIVPQADKKSEKAQDKDFSFFIPVGAGWITATSLSQENIYTIKFFDRQLNEKWSTIYERSRTDSSGNIVHYAKILGYNDHVLAFHSALNDIRKSGYVYLDNGQKKQEENQWTNLLIDEDHRTVLGQLIQNEDLSYTLMIGNRPTPLSQSVTGYSASRLLLSGNSIFMGFYYPQNETLKLIVLDYHTGVVHWEYTLTSSKSINDVLFSVFQDKFIVEIESTQRNNLYLFNREDGKLVSKF